MNTATQPVAVEAQAPVADASIISARAVREVPLSPEMIALLHAEDKRAATSVVSIMGTIFTLALLGYIGIFLWVLWGG